MLSVEAGDKSIGEDWAFRLFFPFMSEFPPRGVSDFLWRPLLGLALLPLLGCGALELRALTFFFTTLKSPAFLP